MKGIVLAGGTGSRLYPITEVVNKQLLPIHDKPMIFYPLSVLLIAGITEILIITTPEDLNLFKKLLGNGEQYGCQFKYEVQQEPKGLAEAFIIGEEFIGEDSVTLILGDNILYGSGLGNILRKATDKKKPTIFAYQVDNPQDFGVVKFDDKLNAIKLVEKPSEYISSYAIPGIYIYDNSVISKAKIVKPSSRGEIEITSINNLYLSEKNLTVEILPRGIAWLDTGTPHNLQQASEFVSIIEKSTSKKIACLEEIAYQKGLIDKKELLKSIAKYGKSSYGRYLNTLIQ